MNHSKTILKMIQTVGNYQIVIVSCFNRKKNHVINLKKLLELIEY